MSLPFDARVNTSERRSGGGTDVPDPGHGTLECCEGDADLPFNYLAHDPPLLWSAQHWG